MTTKVSGNILIGAAEEYKWIFDPHTQDVYMTDGEQRIVFQMPIHVFAELSTPRFEEL